MRVTLVDPSAFTPPYDRSLAAALAGAGADVQLLTSRFLYGPVPEPAGYRVRELFYRRSAERGLEAPGRLPFKLAEHLGDMSRLRRAVGPADVVHYQWLTVPSIDRYLLPRKRPRVLTAHYVAPPGASRHQLRRARRIFGAMDAVIAHTRYGRDRLVDEVGLPPDRVRVIPHGSFDYLTEIADEAPLPPELAESSGPVVLMFGLIRPYKGVEVLLDAFAGIEGAELWIAGNPRMDISDLVERSGRLDAPVKWVPRFIEDREIPALMRRADLLVLPYLDAEQSGVLYTGLAFGKAMVVSDVGGLAEVALEDGGAVAVPAGDPEALAREIERLLGDNPARSALEGRALSLGFEKYSWERIAEMTLDLYRELGA